MLLGVDHVFVRRPLADGVKLTRLAAAPRLDGRVTGTASARRYMCSTIADRMPRARSTG